MRSSKRAIVVNTSPWIALSICGQVPLLRELYSDIYLPSSVKEEIMAGGRRDIGIRELEEHSWLRFEKITGIEKVEFLHELERGEAEVIVLAKEKGIGLVLLDEKVARLQARILGLEVIGTLGLLLRAKRTGLIYSIRPLICKMLDNGIWIKKEIANGILTNAGETEI